MNESKTYGLSAMIAILLLLVGFIGGYKATDYFRAEPVIVNDTIVINHWDTIKIDQPVEVVRTIIRHDTLRKVEFVNITDEDLLKKLDSLNLEIEIPIEQAIYKDSIENAKYEAYISGYKASLDSICINCRQTETIITITERIPAKRIAFGIQAGIGYAGKVSPYIGIGIQYKLW